MADSEFVRLQQSLAGEYSLERELGRGGMGIVYLAREVQLDRLVAIKVLRPELAARPDVRARFLREARLAASLSHPNISQIFRVVEAPELTYITMQCIDGETLGERLRRRGPLKAVDAVTMLREVAWALSHAHRSGIVHRDVKPDNILLERETDRALVSDFGIATAHADEGASDLESHAQRARAQLATLSQAMRSAEGSVPETDEASVAQDSAQRELRDAISALESIRLHLLRLHGGVADLQPITTVLDAARRVGDDLDRLDRAQREVNDSPRRIGFDLRTPTPA